MDRTSYPKENCPQESNFPIARAVSIEANFSVEARAAAWKVKSPLIFEFHKYRSEPTYAPSASH